MRKISGIILLACLTIPFLGTYSWLRIQRRVVRREVKDMLIAGVNEEELTLLKFNDKELETELRWLRDKEFAYQDQMYDVVKRELVNGSHYLWCWPDNEETKLDHQLNDLVSSIMGKMPQQKENNTRLINFLTNLYHFNTHSWQTLLVLGDTINYTRYSFSYANVYHSPPAPPPELS